MIENFTSMFTYSFSQRLKEVIVLFEKDIWICLKKIISRIIQLVPQIVLNFFLLN